MRTTSPKPSIALLLLVIAICCQNVPAHNSQTLPPAQPAGTAQPSTQSQVRQGSPGGDVTRGAADIAEGTAKGPRAAANRVGNGTADLVALPPLNAAGNVAKAAALAG